MGSIQVHGTVLRQAQGHLFAKIVHMLFDAQKGHLR